MKSVLLFGRTEFHFLLHPEGFKLNLLLLLESLILNLRLSRKALLFESDLSGNLTNTSNITLAREFADLSLDENLGRIYLYTADAGEPWAVALGGQFLFRGTTPVFAANRVRIGAGALDPADRTRHFVTAAGKADINHLLVPNPRMLAAKHWTAYR